MATKISLIPVIRLLYWVISFPERRQSLKNDAIIIQTALSLGK
jgi:hypothetical protein